MAEPTLSPQARSSIIRVVGVYVLVATAWILWSDVLLARVEPAGRVALALGIAKGVGFVAVTAALLAWLLRRQFLRLEEKEVARETEAERLSAIADIVPGGLYVTDAAGNATFANRALHDLFDSPNVPVGTSTADLEGWQFRDWAGRPLADSELPATMALRRGEVVSDQRFLVTTPSGRRVFASFSAAPLRDGEGRVTGAVVTVSDMTRLQGQRAELERRGRVLSMLSTVERELTRHPPERELMASVCRVIVEEGGYRLAWIGLVTDDPARTVSVVAAHGTGAEVFRRQQIETLPGPHGDGPTGRAVRGGRTVRVDDTETDASLEPWREVLLAHGMRSMVSVPFADDRGQVMGAMSVYDGRPEAFPDSEVALIETLVADLGYGIVSGRSNAARRRAEARAEQVLSGVLRAMARLLEIRDPFTAGHELRTGQICVVLARELGVDPITAEGLRISAELHDIGKFVVPAEILARPVRLGPSELEIVKRHASVGEEVLANIEFPWPIATIVGQHHERLDGSGYPRGLKGDAIRLEARILAVADVYEAITSHRPFRPAASHEEAMAELRAGAGKTFDPLVVAALDRVATRYGPDPSRWPFTPPGEPLDQRDASA